MLALNKIARHLFGTTDERKIKPYLARVARINALEEEYKALSDAALAAKTAHFKEQLAKGASLDSLLEPAFAAVREAARRALSQRHFDVQLIGGMALHDKRHLYCRS